MRLRNSGVLCILGTLACACGADGVGSNAYDAGGVTTDGATTRATSGSVQAGRAGAQPTTCDDSVCIGNETCISCPQDCDACSDAIEAASCEREDVQAAITAASDGATVVVPAGRCSWTEGLDIAGKGIHVTGVAPGAVRLVHDAGSQTLLSLNEDGSHHVEVSNLVFEQGSGGQDAWDGMYLSAQPTNGGRPMLVHHNAFSTGGSRRAIRWSVNRGVVWGNTFTTDRQDGNAIAFVDGDNSSWTTPPTMGTADRSGESNVYLEDNTFTEIPAQAIDADSNSRVVIRHNLFDNSAMASHGADTSDSGTRHWEIYNNEFVFTDEGDCDGSQTINLAYTFYVRGGSGIIADNIIPDMNSCAWGDKSEIYMTIQNLRRNAGPYPCWDTYPAPRQIGQGHDGNAWLTDPVYFWGNTGGGNYDDPGIGDYSPNECGSGSPSASNFIEEGRDYFVNTMKPGYTEYPHPHPLRAGH